MKRNLHLIALPCLLALTACDVSPLASPEAQANDATVARSSTSPLHATYQIEDEEVTLHNGRADLAATPGSATRVRTSLWDGSKVYGDLDADGDDDVALVLIQEAGGSGTFSYLAVAVREKDGYQGSDTLFLGNRIGPPEIVIHGGVIEVRFLDHADGEPFSDSPTRNRVVRAKLQGHVLEAL